MIKLFDEFLLEAKQVGILYHYTNLLNLEKILKTNTLKTSFWAGPKQTMHSKKDEKYISLTRDKNFLDIFRDIGGTECRIVIDGDKLSNKYKIEPYNDFYRNKTRPIYTESEERLYNEITNLDKYVIKYQIYSYDNVIYGTGITEISYNEIIDNIINTNKKIEII